MFEGGRICSHQKAHWIQHCSQSKGYSSKCLFTKMQRAAFCQDKLDGNETQSETIITQLCAVLAKHSNVRDIAMNHKCPKKQTPPLLLPLLQKIPFKKRKNQIQTIQKKRHRVSILVYSLVIFWLSYGSAPFSVCEPLWCKPS